MTISTGRVIAAGCLVAALAGVARADVRLIEAARNGDLDAVRTLLKQRVDVNARAGDGATALHWAVHQDDPGLVDMLIDAGADVNAANDLGVTPLYLGCTNRGAAMVRKLLDARANPNAALPSGETVLMNCARTGDAGAVRALLTAGAAVEAKESAHAQTALMWAAAQRHPEAVAALLAHGADVKARSRTYAQTVTSEVTQRAGREELNYDVVRGGMTALLFAARSGDAGSARLLVAAGADVNDTLPDGVSALTLAAHSGQGAVGAALLELGADANAAGAGYTPLHAAVLRSDLNLVQALLARGANPNARMTKGTPMRRTSQDFDLPAALIGSTPYLLAAKFLEVPIMRALAAGGADTRLPMRGGATPLMAAVGMGAAANTDRRGVAKIDGGRAEPESLVLETLAAALELGADVNAGNDSGDTALHSAAAAGLNGIVRYLANHGAALNAKNGRGLTPLAALTTAKDQAGRQSTIELLRTLGATE
jgi:uncharacterized protein